MNQSKVYSQQGLTEETPLNIDLNINNKRQDCTTGTVWAGSNLWEGGE
jgi:hypothetical protein